MHFKFRNINNAFRQLVKYFHVEPSFTLKKDSRNGPVMMVPEPVIVTYTHPRERVLFNAARDANPFFHLFESLWMLAGRNDVKPLEYYVSTIGKYSDDGKTLHGAYGCRWKRWFGLDQLRTIIYELKANPDSRRCVLAMWDGGCEELDGANRSDLLKARQGGKDVPCNTHAYFSLRESPDYDLAFGPLHPEVVSGKVQQGDRIGKMCLDMTVCNRSNDLVWGMLGANIVHFSILLEYMANCLGVEVGVYNQMTNNLHAYESNWEPEKWLESNDSHLYGHNLLPGENLVKDQVTFDRECAAFVSCIDGTFEEPFLRNVAQPMMAAFRAHKQRRYYGDLSAQTLINRVQAEDWKIAGAQWLFRRQKAWEEKSHAKT